MKFGLTLNYDNRPAVVGKETDYVYVLSIGWEDRCILLMPAANFDCLNIKASYQRFVYFIYTVLNLANGAMRALFSTTRSTML